MILAPKERSGTTLADFGKWSVQNLFRFQAKGCRRYQFTNTCTNEITAVIRDSRTPAQWSVKS